MKRKKEFEKKVLSDKKYKELSKKAFDAEKKRLLAEKPYVNDDDGYDKLYQNKNYINLMNASEKAYREKEKYVKKMAKDYADTIKEAKLKDLNITENKEVAKKYISDKFDDIVWDGNLEYDPDNYYERGIEKEKYK